MYTKEEILTQINHIVYAAQKRRSNALEFLEKFEVTKTERGISEKVYEQLTPFTHNGESLIVGLGLKILDEEQHQTANNVLNFYVMANRDPGVEIALKVLWDEELYPIRLEHVIGVFDW